jgi:hypothetical protein
MEPRLTQTDEPDLDIVIITKHNKIIHKIYMKMNTLIKSTYGLLHDHNVSLILTRVMREINKESLYGFEKKNIAISIMVLLLDALGTPDMVSKMTATAIADTVELIYSHSMHRYKKTGKCIIL